MRTWTRVALAACLVMGLAGVQAQVLQETASGSVDWQSRIIRAKGIGIRSEKGGRAGQIRVARMDALRKILETVEGMALTSETTVQEYVLENDRIQTEVRGICRNFREVGDPVYLSDGSIELTVEMNLGADLQNALLGGQDFQEGTPVPVQYSDMDPGAIYTGLVVDCKGLGLRPALAPRILDESGGEVYGSAWVDRDWALQNGLVGYVKSVEQARQNQDRIGAKPLLVKAKAVQGSQKADMVIADRDGKVLHALGENLKFLSECRVLVVVD